MIQQSIVLGTLIAVGLAVGRLRLGGLSLGTSAILFVALVAGHFGFSVPGGVGTVGLALFVYSVGLAGGPTFFRGLGSEAASLSVLGGGIVLIGIATAAAMAWALKLPVAVAGGVLAGALTSTPALGAIGEALGHDPAVAVGFGIAYPIGILAVTLMVQLTLRFSPPDDSSITIAAGGTIDRCVIDVSNPAVGGRRPSELAFSDHAECQISRVWRENGWQPIPADYSLSIGDRVLMVGTGDSLSRWGQTLGEVRPAGDVVLDGDHQRKNVVVTSDAVMGRSLGELRFRSRYGVTVTRVRRHDLEFVPSSRTRLEFGDLLTLVGGTESLSQITPFVGHRPRTLHETDLLSLAVGITVGLVVGAATVQIGGVSFSLGLAGGPLLAGLLLGHFRKLGPIRGSFPPASKLLMTEGGLALFLADAGVGAGGGVAEILMRSGPSLCLAAAATAVLPMFAGYAVATWMMRLRRWRSLGAMCGGMTSTPGLAVLTAATDRPDPVTAYVSAYPAALVVITIVSPLVMRMLA